MFNEVEACTACGGDMRCEKVASWSHDGFVDRYFVMCALCGFGPTIAFVSELKAIQAWNTFALEELAELTD